jgi:hypothetical protein
MSNIATHVRIFDPQPTDDLVTKRTAAIKELSSGFAKGRSVPEIFQSANDLALAVEAKGAFSEALAKEIESAISKPAEAFIAEGQELEMTVCGLLGALQSLDHPPSSSSNLAALNVFAIGLWSALSFQAPRLEAKLEALRVELLGKAQEYTLRAAINTRRRIKVPDINFAVPEPFDAAGVAASFKTGVATTIEALRANAAVDREEIDLLWWVLGDWSELLDRRFSALDNPAAAAIASGLEAGRMLRRMPADAHRHLVLRPLGHVHKPDLLSLPGLLKVLDGDRGRLAAPYAHDKIVAACPAAFPLLTALRSGLATDAKAKIKRSLQDWACRALLESAALHVTSHLPSVAI